MALTGFFSQPANPYQKSYDRAPSPLSMEVRPLPEIDDRVANEVAKAKQVLDRLDPDNFLTNPYLVSAIYYHDNFLGDIPVSKSNADPDRRIVGQISNMLSVELKVRFVRLLHEAWDRSKPSGPPQFVKPVNYVASAGGRRSHRYAIDLFAAEGTTVHSVSRGMVVLADRDWSPDNIFSTTSRKEGNAVIVFDPDKDRFYRYCHLSTVLVSAGQLLVSSQKIGSVGHTGLNASRPGHGQHLHFEGNEFLDGHVHAMDYRRLRAMLRQWRTSPE
jgi:murein DD-endopeptidase MepM/ murein hydrolase activator NlpD